jgi:hypothetical protein
MAAFEYEREDYQQYLERLKHKGTYQEYENAIFEMNELKNDIKADLGDIPHVDKVACLIDQVDNVYWGDIGFHCEKPLDQYDVFLVAGAICGVLEKHAESCYSYSLYYNNAMDMFMYTKVAVEADDGPNLYAEGTRRFVVR